MTIRTTADWMLGTAEPPDPKVFICRLSSDLA